MVIVFQNICFLLYSTKKKKKFTIFITQLLHKVKIVIPKKRFRITFALILLSSKSPFPAFILSSPNLKVIQKINKIFKRNSKLNKAELCLNLVFTTTFILSMN